jgi:hypothetical protein
MLAGISRRSCSHRKAACLSFFKNKSKDFEYILGNDPKPFAPPILTYADAC